MNPAGILMVISGALVLCQVFGGNALGRLGITGSPDGTEAKAAAPKTPAPKTGLDGKGSTGSGGGGGGGGPW